jgi:hypothetical protein
MPYNQLHRVVKASASPLSRPDELARRTAAFHKRDRPERVELGPSLIPNADIARNVCYPRTHQSQIGHKQS